MILSAIAILVIGLVAGVSMDALLRANDPHSLLTIGGGVGGAIVGASVRYALGPDEVLVRMFSALAGAMVVAFAIRARASAAEARRLRSQVAGAA